jgi:serine/threonine-protein kinase
MLFAIGPYKIYEMLAQGGMGEVFLAYDPRCGRKVALKRIRSDLQHDFEKRIRFLYEARLASQLAHPCIIPILEIVETPDLLYYTMPYIEGTTLKELIRQGQEQELAGESLDPRLAIPSLLHAFCSLCHAVAYIHSRAVLHRDLKPSNLLIGINGELTILDWGLAKIAEKDQAAPEATFANGRVSKVTGTISYVAPEQLAGQPADFRTEIYALGLILYEMLTLRPPFHRETLEQYRYTVRHEALLDPALAAPHRGIFPALSQIVLKCLAHAPEARYQSADLLIADLENVAVRHAGWFRLDAYSNGLAPWQQIENPARFLALEQPFYLSKDPLTDLVRISVKVKLQAPSKFYLLLAMPAAFIISSQDSDERDESCDEMMKAAAIRGICLAVSSEASTLYWPPDKEIALPFLSLTKETWHTLLLEKIDSTLHISLDGQLQGIYVHHFPLAYTHIGYCASHAGAEIKEWEVSIGGYAFGPNPLSAANTFFAHRHFKEAFEEYRQVAEQQPQTVEGRKALFRSGLVLLEEFILLGGEKIGEACLQQFDKLSSEWTSAPLAPLGKALFYQYQGAYAEEVRCFESAFSHYAKHPLISVWHCQLLARLLESSQFDRTQLCTLLLLALFYLPEEMLTPQLHQLLSEQQQAWEPLYFILDQDAKAWPLSKWRLSKAIRLAFWLKKPEALAQVIDRQQESQEPHLYSIANALYALLELGAYELAEQKLEQIYSKMLDVQAMAQFHWIHEALLVHRQEEALLSPSLLCSLPRILNQESFRCVLHILLEARQRKQTAIVRKNVEQLEKQCRIPEEFQKILGEFEK